MPSLFSSILRGYLWVAAILFLAAPVVIFSSFRSAFRERAVEDLTRSAEALVPAVAGYLETGEYSRMDSVLNSAADRMNARITVIGRDGTVYSDTEESPGDMENHRTRVEVIAAFNGLPGTSSRNSATLGREMIYAAVPVFAGDSIPAVVRTSFFFESYAAAVNPVLVEMIFIVAVAALFAFVSAWLISRRIAAPIGDLAEVADRIAAGDLGARAAPGYTREQNRLARTMNQTLATTEQLIETLSESDGRNRAILHSMSEGVLVVSGSGEILLVNQSFSNIFKMNEPGSELPPEVREVLSKGDSDSSRGVLHYQGKVVAWASSMVENSSGMVFSFSDITKEHNLSEIKRNFAVNVSHELRTPLTAIKGYAETLREESAGDSAGYLEVILRNTDRLIALVKDIQILSEVESGESALKLEPVTVGSVMETVIPLFRDQAEKKGLTLSFTEDKSGLVLMADRYMIEQVLVNLVDNAIKYTDEGSVEVMVSSRGGSAVFAVSDTGRGIPEEQQERVFERFFVVDRSRSRKLGGTGLGLSISRHIVEAHGGTISVTSAPGRGSIFLFSIPLAD